MICYFSSDIEHLLKCQLVICISSLEKCLFMSSAHSPIGQLFLCCWVIGVVSLFWKLSPYWLHCLQIFSTWPAVWFVGKVLFLIKPSFHNITPVLSFVCTSFSSVSSSYLITKAEQTASGWVIQFHNSDQQFQSEDPKTVLNEA